MPDSKVAMRGEIVRLKAERRRLENQMDRSTPQLKARLRKTLAKVEEQLEKKIAALAKAK